METCTLYDEMGEFEKWPVELQGSGVIVDHFGRIFGLSLKALQCSTQPLTMYDLGSGNKIQTNMIHLCRSYGWIEFESSSNQDN